VVSQNKKWICALGGQADVWVRSLRETLSRPGGEREGYHVFVGGGFGRNQAVGRQVFAGVTATELPRALERMLRAFLKHRQGRETFQQFTNRLDVGRLQEMFEAET
jgi:ferredoxin-nitrite reductase